MRPEPERMRWVLPWIVAAVGSCSVPDLDATGKACPCGEGAVCDPCTNTCVSAIYGGDGCDDDPLAAVQVGELQAAWSTPHQIRWTWSVGPDDDPDQLVGYRLVVARSEEELLTEEGSARVFTEIENPELRAYYLRHTTGVDVVDSTLADGLEPDVLYFARLEARDSAGRVAVTNIAQQRTQVEEREAHVVFDDAALGEVEPTTLSFEADCGDGSGCYRWSCEGAAVCFDNLRLRDRTTVLSELITEGQFSTTAFLEIVLALDGSPSDWSDVRIRVVDDDPYTVKALTFRSTATVPGPRTYELPLRSFVRGGEAMAYEVLDTPLFETGAGLFVVPGGAATIHRVRVVW